MNLNSLMNPETLLKAIAAATLILAAFGKKVQEMAGSGDPSNTAALCFGVGLYFAAPIVAGLLSKPKAPTP